MEYSFNIMIFIKDRSFTIGVYILYKYLGERNKVNYTILIIISNHILIIFITIVRFFSDVPQKPCLTMINVIDSKNRQ